MNKTIISIEVQDNGGKEATIIVTGERNNQTLFEEHFTYKDEEKHPLRLHFLIDKFLNNHGIAKGENMAIPIITIDYNCKILKRKNHPKVTSSQRMIFFIVIRIIHIII